MTYHISLIFTTKYIWIVYKSINKRINFLKLKYDKKCIYNYFIFALGSKIRRWFAAIYIAVIYFYHSSRAINWILNFVIILRAYEQFRRITFFLGQLRNYLAYRRNITRCYFELVRYSITCQPSSRLLGARPCISENSFTVTYNDGWVAALKPERYPYVPSINVFHARKIKTNETECRQCCAVAPRNSSIRLSLIRRWQNTGSINEDDKLT